MKNLVKVFVYNDQEPKRQVGYFEVDIYNDDFLTKLSTLFRDVNCIGSVYMERISN